MSLKLCQMKALKCLILSDESGLAPALSQPDLHGHAYIIFGLGVHAIVKDNEECARAGRVP